MSQAELTPERKEILENLAKQEQVRAERIGNPHMEKLAANGGLATIVAAGVVVGASHDMVRAWQELARLTKENQLITEDRRRAFEMEKIIMGSIELPLGHQIQHKGRLGRIIGISRVDVIACGVFNHPLYQIEYQVSPGAYHDRSNEVETPELLAHVYARDLKDYGLDPPPGVIDGSSNAA